MRDDVEIVLDQVANRRRIGQLKQDIIDWPKVDVVDVMLLHVIQHLPVLHLGVNGAVAARSEGKVALTLDHHLAIVGESRDAALREEDNGLFIISEVVVGLEIVHNLIVIHLAGHQVPLDQAASVVHSGSVLGDVAEPDESVGEVSEEGESALQAEVEHSFRMVESEPSSLSATHDAHSHFPLGNGHVSKLVEMPSLSLEVLVSCNIGDRRKLVLLILLEGRLFNIDMLVKLGSLVVIDAF